MYRVSLPTGIALLNTVEGLRGSLWVTWIWMRVTLVLPPMWLMLMVSIYHSAPINSSAPPHQTGPLNAF